jgi:anthranilate synthase component I
LILTNLQKNCLYDIINPIKLYYQLRNNFINTIFWELFDNVIITNNLSIICVNPISEIIVYNYYITYILTDYTKYNIYLGYEINIYILFKIKIIKLKFNNFISPYSGYYGYFAYNSIIYFDRLLFDYSYYEYIKIPEIRLVFFKNLVVFNHIYNEISIITHKLNKVLNNHFDINNLFNQYINTYYFNTLSTIKYNITDNQYKNNVSKGIELCLKGDIFQIVLSRYYKQKFKGDEFNVYRVIRSINPSNYLIYFDYVNYKIFGSSPESQLIIKNKKAYLYPIAGTIIRSSNIKKLFLNSYKDNYEHIMLVDLSRNDLNKTTLNIKVEKYKQIKYLSNVIHFVSKVSGNLKQLYYNFKIFGSSFPAGTLSGAPKYRAIELIETIENKARLIYGGAIGLLGINGEIKISIIIRSFISKNNIIFAQSGAGIIAKSKSDNELKEISNKLSGLKKSLYLSKCVKKNFYFRQL